MVDRCMTSLSFTLSSCMDLARFLKEDLMAYPYLQRFDSLGIQRPGGEAEVCKLDMPGRVDQEVLYAC